MTTAAGTRTALILIADLALAASSPAARAQTGPADTQEIVK